MVASPCLNVTEAYRWMGETNTHHGVLVIVMHPMPNCHQFLNNPLHRFNHHHSPIEALHASTAGHAHFNRQSNHGHCLIPVLYLTSHAQLIKCK